MWGTKAARSTSALCLSISVSIALFRSGFLSNTFLSYQLCVLLLSFGALPLLQYYHHLLPKTFKFVLATLYTVLVLVPLFISLIINLFTGHRTPGAQWYSGIWRVYAILGLWMLIAWTIENKVKPVLKNYNFPLLFGADSSMRSVSLAAENLKREQRDKAVAEVYAVIKEKAMEKVKAKRRVELKKSQMEGVIKELAQVRRGIKEKKKVLSKDANAELSTEIRELESKANNLEERVESMEEQITYITMRIDLLDEALAELRSKWNEARDPENYKQFYR